MKMLMIYPLYDPFRNRLMEQLFAKFSYELWGQREDQLWGQLQIKLAEQLEENNHEVG